MHQTTCLIFLFSKFVIVNVRTIEQHDILNVVPPLGLNIMHFLKYSMSCETMPVICGTFYCWVKREIFFFLKSNLSNCWVNLGLLLDRNLAMILISLLGSYSITWKWTGPLQIFIYETGNWWLGGIVVLLAIQVLGYLSWVIIVCFSFLLMSYFHLLDLILVFAMHIYHFLPDLFPRFEILRPNAWQVLMLMSMIYVLWRTIGKAR